MNVRNKFTLSYFLLFLVIFCQWSCNKGKHYHLYGQNNAVWSESIYLRGYQPTTHEELTVDRINKYAKLLKENHIKYVYLFAGPYGNDGHLPQYAFSDTAVKTIRILKKKYPELQVLPWIGGVQNKTVYLGNSTWVKNALEDTKKLIGRLNVPGVHIDLEFIMQGEPFLQDVTSKERPGDKEAYGSNVNEFHKKLRALLPKAFISAVVVATSPDTKPWKRKTSLDELKVLVKYIDQLSFLYYDTFINDQKLFENNCVRLIEDIEILKQEQNIQYLVSIGTFINDPQLQKYRNLKIESIPNSLKVIKGAILSVNSSHRLIDGISIFCDWETDQAEWDQFTKNWTSK